MNPYGCFEVAGNGIRHEPLRGRATGGNPQPQAIARRCLGVASWVVPSAILMLLPKCPLSVAAYVSLESGVGLSFSTAGYLRQMLVFLCVASLLYTARSLRGFPARLSALHRSNSMCPEQTQQGPE